MTLPRKETTNIETMRRLSADIRIEMLKALSEIGSGHVGGSASIADVLGVLYGGVMRVDPKNPQWEDRDWLVLSKGHCGPALYAALALRGFFPMEWMKTINGPHTNLPSHADRIRTPGIDMSTGSLGQGVSAAVGIALGNRLKGKQSYVYCIVGDGEINEGQVWESAQSANHFRLDHFILFVDWNKKQLDGYIEDVCDPVSIADKFKAFGFDVQVVKGYDAQAIYEAVLKAKNVSGKPHCIILDTYKGLGVTFAEQADFNHFIDVSREDAEAAIREIEKRYADDTFPGGNFTW